MGIGYDVMGLRGMLDGKVERLERSRRRQAEVFRGGRPDKFPAYFSGKLTEEQRRIGSYDLEESFYDSDKMLCGQMQGVFAVLNCDSDAVPSIRANTGTGTLMSLLGRDQLVFKDKMPWFKAHFSKSELSGMGGDDIRIGGDFELAIRHMKRYIEVLGDSVPIYCPDTQGPFDLAHLMLGDAIFLELYDDPPFVHHVMELALEIGIRAHEWSKEITGEPRDKMHHGCNLYCEDAGIRICEDSTAIIGPEAIDEFALPYSRRLAQHFGGAFVHYCGRNDFLSRRICESPEFKIINFGHIPGHEHDHVFEDDMRLCQETGTVYLGNWPRHPGETGMQYLDRMHIWASRGVLVPDCNAAVGDGGFGNVEDAVEYWYSK